MTRPSSRSSALIVDFHRVVIDSEYVLYRLWRDEFRQRGLLLTTEAWADYRTAAADSVASGGTNIEAMLGVLARRVGLLVTDLDRLARDIATRHLDALAALPARPGITAWLQDAHRAGWRCAVLCTDSDPNVRSMLDTLGLSDVVDTVLQAPSAHPSPEQNERSNLYQQILASLDADVTHTIVATASPTAIMHARAAGCQCLAIPDKLNAHLLRAGRSVVVIDPELISFAQATALVTDTVTLPQHRTRSCPQRADRIKGSLAGLALGDAVGKLIGYRTEEQLDAETQQALNALGTGQDPPAVFTGRITDDTVLTLALADTIITTGRVSRDAFQACLKTINPQGGWQVFKLKASPDQVIVARDGNTNGCVPRSAVLAFLHTPDTVGDLLYDVLKIATLTHSDPAALTTAALFATALTHAIDGYSPHETFDAMESLCHSVIRITAGDEDMWAALRQHVLAADKFDTPVGYVDYLEDAVGIVVEARSSAVTGLCLGLTGLPVDQVLPVLLRRRTLGDLDSTAAVYGALAGAFHPNQIPTGWTNRIDQYCGQTLGNIANQLHRIRSARLQNDPQLSMSELARRVGMSAPAVTEPGANTTSPEA